MKKVILVSIIAIILITLVSITAVEAGPTYTYTTPTLVVKLISQEPDPVEPGEIVTLRFKIENNGTATQDDVKARLLLNYPFSIYSGNNDKNIGTLRARQTGADAVIVEYKVKVDAAAIQGIEEVDLQVSLGTGWKTFEDFPINIRTRDTNIDVQTIKSEPETVSPGEEFDLLITLKNNADSVARNIQVNLNLTSDNTPFAPTSSTAEKNIYQISGNAARILRYDLVALPDAAGGIYKVPISISYTDESGATQEISSIISLSISSQPDLLIYVEDSDITTKIREGDVSIRIVNRGLTNIKLLTATLEETKDYTLLTHPESYVGDIDTDDFETATYHLKLKTFDKIVNLPLTLTYRDITNKQQTDNITVTLNTQSRGLLPTILLGIGKTLLTIGIILLVLYGLYWFYQRRKKAKKDE